MATEVTIDGEGRVVEAEERWRAVEDKPYILTPEDAKNLRDSIRASRSQRVQAWKRLQPLFTASVWQQLLGHIEGMEG